MGLVSEIFIDDKGPVSLGRENRGEVILVTELRLAL